ncbi:hypothetical protein [Streptomyces sp. NPDC059072]|uniref:hypothetical protein n=1 Tax=Streptomyces sp. NPDC059072 TaxID=3346715 RepID=UPI003692766A
MGELADRVAGLENELEEAREALGVVERIDETIELAADEVESVYGTLCNLSWELDGEIADYNYPAVERYADELRGLVDGAHLWRAVDTVLLLTAVREGHPLPEASIKTHMDRVKDAKASHPTLTQEELDTDFRAVMDRAENTWKDVFDDGSWDSEQQRQDHLANHLHEARLEAVADRAERAGRFLMKLCDHIAESVWPEVTAALRAADVEGVARALKQASAAGQEAPAAYELYVVNLSAQYESAPSSLGAMGEQLMAFESWMGLQNQE